MNELRETVLLVLTRAWALWRDERILGSAVALLLVMAVALPLRHGGSFWRRLLTPRARTDLLYTVFYVGGFYAFLISGPVYRLLGGLLERYAPALKLDLIAPLPPLLQFAVASVVLDGVLYFAHRWAHTSRWLWAFHSIHHSQEDLTPLSNFRFHFVDASVKGLLQFPVAFVMGVPSGVWVATVWVQIALDGLAHSGLGWGYGPLGRLIVSPRFHRLHHSAEEQHRDTNFGLSYSFWDHLFGTAMESPIPPRAYGVSGQHVPESVLRQLALPFVSLARGERPEP